MSQSSGSCFIVWLLLKLLPYIINYSWRVVTILIWDSWIAVKIKARRVLIRTYWLRSASSTFTIRPLCLGLALRTSDTLRNIFNFKHLSHLLLSAAMMHRCCPLVVEFLASFPVFLLLFSLADERMLEKFRPWESLTRGLVKKTLQEALKLRAHILWELDWIFDNEVDQGVDAVSIEGWCAYEQFVDDDTQWPQIDCVVVGQLLD